MNLLFSSMIAVLLLCPFCVKDGKQSTVTEGLTSGTCVAGPPAYYDKDGTYYPYKDPNVYTTDYQCSNGHHFSVIRNADGKIIDQTSVEGTNTPPNENTPPQTQNKGLLNKLVKTYKSHCAPKGIIPIWPAGSNLGTHHAMPVYVIPPMAGQSFQNNMVAPQLIVPYGMNK